MNAQTRPDPTSTGRPSSWLLIVGVIAVVAALAISWFFVLGPGSGQASASPSAAPSEAPSEAPSADPSVEPVPSATPEPAETPVPSEAAAPPRLAWSPATGFDPGAQVGTVEVVGGRWIAAGSVFEGDSLAAAIWASDDGTTWTRAHVESTRGQFEFTRVSEVVELGTTLVAIGAWGAFPSDQASAISWTSTDGGATWAEHRGAPEAAALGSVIPAGPGLMAAGLNYSIPGPSDSFVATSADGITWEPTDAVIEGVVTSVESLGDRIVAVGFVTTASGAADAAAWYTDDSGATWTPAEMPDGGSSLSVDHLVPFGDGLAAIGNGGRADVALFVSAAWVTSDGETWELFGVAEGASAKSVAGIDGGLVAVGNFAAHDIGPGVAWTSADGQTWVEGDGLGDGSVRLAAVAVADDVAVAVGECQSEACEAVAWVGEVTR